MKSEFRKRCLEERRKLSEEYRKTAGEEIFKRLVSSDIYNAADKIFIYISMKYEVPTEKIIERALLDGKTVAVPVTGDNREMFFVRYDRDRQLAKTKLGVYEPICTRDEELPCDDGTLLAVPGVAFDVQGHRMGYGGGYYDTYIERYGVKNTAALAFDVQVKDSIPFEKHDRIMKDIITEKRLIGGMGCEQTY